MWDFLRKINQEGTTIILTTHYLEEAENLCRHIAIINHGHIVEHNAMAALLRKLHTNRYILELRKPAPCVPTIEGYQLEVLEDHTFAVDVPLEMGLHGLLDQLAAQGMEVVSMRTAANRLEQLFIDLVENQRMDSARKTA
jgi:ABC-2 type transport system ATP-binding protein